MTFALVPNNKFQTAASIRGGGISLRKRTLYTAVFALLSSCAVGQSTPRFDVFGGYSYLRSSGASITSANASGWGTSLNWNWKHWLGLKADIGGDYCCSGEREYNFLFGPQITFRRSHANFFVHGLGGVSHGNPAGVSESVAAFAFGGGLDWKIRNDSGLALRLVQADYLGTNYGNLMQHNFRYSTGIVFGFGGKK